MLLFVFFIPHLSLLLFLLFQLRPTYLPLLLLSCLTLHVPLLHVLPSRVLLPPPLPFNAL